MTDSVFHVLREEKLNRIQIRHDWRTGTFRLYAAREWDADTRFADYNRAFTAWSLHPSDGRWLSHAETLAAFERHGAAAHL